MRSSLSSKKKRHSANTVTKALYLQPMVVVVVVVVGGHIEISSNIKHLTIFVGKGFNITYKSVLCLNPPWHKGGKPVSKIIWCTGNYGIKIMKMGSTICTCLTLIIIPQQYSITLSGSFYHVYIHVHCVCLTPFNHISKPHINILLSHFKSKYSVLF